MTLAFSYLRFSTKPQGEGDSRRRQIDDSRAYAQGQGWTLDETLRDEGVSAWQGKHRETGDLGKFLALVKSGKVVPGSWLIVEAMDRLSREKTTRALPVFMDIVNSGCGIVTMADRKQYTADSIDKNPFELMYSIGLMASANEYSMKLSQRVRAARETALKDLQTGKRKVVHGRPPFWLRIDRETKTHKIDPVRLPLLKRIVAMAMEGSGGVTIAGKLNRERIPTLHSGTVGWTDTTIMRVLRSRSLIGEYQPMHFVKGKRESNGEPVKDYYPSVMSTDDFYRLQSILDTRKTNSGGRMGKGIANIFGKRLVSGTDGGTMVLVTRVLDKRNPKKIMRYTSLASANAIRGLTKLAGATFPYDAFEHAFLLFVSEVQPGKAPKVDQRAEVIRGELVELRGRIAKLEKMLASGEGDFDRGVELLRKLNAQEKSKARELEAAETAEHAPSVSNRDVVGIAQEMADVSGDERTEVRTRLKLAIAQLCKQIKVYIAVDGITRAALAVVEFANGTTRSFTVKTERYKPAIMSTGDPLSSDPRYVLNTVLSTDFEVRRGAKPVKGAPTLIYPTHRPVATRQDGVVRILKLPTPNSSRN